MNKKIKLLGLSIVATLGFFVGANVVFAQNVVANCNKATLNGYVITNGSTTNSWFEWSTNQNRVTSGSGTRTNNQVFTSDQNFREVISGLTANTIYHYRAVAENSGGRTNGSSSSFRTPSCAVVANQPTVTISADQTNISYNTGTYIRWEPDNATSCYANNGTNGWSRNRSSAGGSFYTGVLTNTTTYSITCTNGSGSATDSVRVRVEEQAVTIQPAVIYVAPTVYGSAPAATTLLATERTNNTARLNGLVFTSAPQSSSAWYEWGESENFGNKTTTMNVGVASVVKHEAVISGLISGRRYYYRIVAENIYGKIHGTTISFVAGTPVVQNTATVIRQPVVQRTTVVARGVSTQSLATLTISGGAEVITNGEKRAYHITWKNTSGGVLKNVVVRVTLPPVMNFEVATLGAYSKADNTVTVDIKDLAVGASGETFVFATSDNSLVDSQLVVVTANMVYTTMANIQGDVIAYTTHKGVRSAVIATETVIEKTTSSLGANILDTGSFLPTTLLGWIILLLLILMLIFLGNYLYGRCSKEKHG